MTRDNMFILIPAFVGGRADDGLRDRIPHLPALHRRGPGDFQHPAGDGHDDAVAHDDLAALQAAAVSSFSTAGRGSSRPDPLRINEGGTCLKPTSSVTPHGHCCWCLCCPCPPFVVAALVGVLVGLIQALTQIQEQTISFAFKADVHCVLVIFMMMGWDRFGAPRLRRGFFPPGGAYSLRGRTWPNESGR